MKKILILLVLPLIGAGCSPVSDASYDPKDEKIEVLERQVEELKLQTVSSTEVAVIQEVTTTTQAVTATPEMNAEVKKEVKPKVEAKVEVKPVQKVVEQPVLKNDSLDKIAQQLEKMANIEEEKKKEEDMKKFVDMCQAKANVLAGTAGIEANNSPMAYYNTKAPQKCKGYDVDAKRIMEESLNKPCDPEMGSCASQATSNFQYALGYLSEQTSGFSQCVSSYVYGQEMYKCLHNQ